jgi:large subunit ribosomal protein L22
MSISATKFKERLATAQVSKDDLAQAIQRDGLRGRKARAAVDHWLRGNGHRQCKGQDVESLAKALNCEANDLRHFVGEYRFARITPRKAQLVVDMIRGKDYIEAWALLQTSKKRAAVLVAKALESAVANAEDSNQGGLDRRNLRVVEARVEPGPTLKRFQPKDRGRAHAILKRTCHIHLAVDER